MSSSSEPLLGYSKRDINLNRILVKNSEKKRPDERCEGG
jgi:hypothetical protein